MRGWIQRFMYGRNGQDHLGLFLIFVYFFFYVVALITKWEFIATIGSVILFYELFRFLSHNLPRRRQENALFLQKIAPVSRWWKLQSTIRNEKDHRYFKCPNCGQQLRVPRGKGKITVTCRACGASFQEKS